MKKMIAMLATLGLAVSMVLAVDYANHMYAGRVYRVALGSGTAPTAADMHTIGIHSGDMVLNTDDDCLYIMHATNAYTKITSAGSVTLTAMTVPLASNKVFVGNASGAANEKTISGFFTINTGGVATATTTASATTNTTASTVVTVQTPGAQTPTITVTKQTGAVTASGANDLASAAGANDLATIAGANNLATIAGANDLVTITNFYDPVAQYSAVLTNANFDVTNTFQVVTNVVWSTAVYAIATNGVVAITPDVATNAVVAITPDVATNAVVAITPDLATNAVVAVTVTGGDAVMTNATATSSALPDFVTNAVSTIYITNQTSTFAKP